MNRMERAVIGVMVFALLAGAALGIGFFAIVRTLLETWRQNP